MKIFVSLLLCLLPVISISAPGNWKTLTNASEIRQFSISDSSLWCATNGGVLKIDAATHEFEKFTNTEGLAQIDIVAIAYDARGYVWVALPDGLLQIYNLETQEWDAYNEFQNRLMVSFILPHGDFVLIGSDIGIAELKLDAKNHWERTWKAEIGAVHEILIADDYIWAAQENGIRRIELSYINKQIPNQWQQFLMSDGLPSNNVTALVEYDNRIAAGTIAGVSFFDGGNWTTPEQTQHQIRDLCVWQEHLVLASDHGVFYKESSGTWSRLGDAGPSVYHVTSTIDDELWFGTDSKALAYYDDALADWVQVSSDGPGSNTFSDLLIDNDGHLWATSSQKPAGGVYYFNGEKWQNFGAQSGLPHFDYRALEIDNFNRIWAGSWGGGVTLFEKINGDSIKITNLGAMDDNLSGISGAPTFVVVTDLLLDPAGYMWFLNYAAGNKQVLAVYDMDGGWQHWTTTDGIRSDKSVALEIDRFGRKWIATSGNGLSVVDDNDTPFDVGDDDLSSFLDTSEGLESNYINALAEDLDGTLWIGTSEGLNYWFGGDIGVRYSVINDNIQALYVDPRNNKWIGTAGGLSVLDSDNFSWIHYTTSNSELVSDFVTCFAFNENTGDIYIGTTNGLSRYETPFTKPANSLASVKGYPNPFVLEPEQSRFYIDNLALNSSINIFTEDGYLVKSIPRSEVLGARVSWDGMNNDGAFVASGIYIYLVATKDGLVKAGKVAVVRQ